jgi:excisionase family DNA binding protein
MQDDLIPADEMAARIRVRPDTIAIWARAGKIPAHWLGRRVVRFRQSEVVAALEAAAAASLGKDRATSLEETSSRDHR